MASPPLTLSHGIFCPCCVAAVTSGTAQPRTPSPVVEIVPSPPPLRVCDARVPLPPGLTFWSITVGFPGGMLFRILWVLNDEAWHWDPSSSIHPLFVTRFLVPLIILPGLVTLYLVPKFRAMLVRV